MRNRGAYYILLLFLVILISACAQINPSEKIACEKSGGAYETGFGETEGAYGYCSCPVDKYQTDKNTCQLITDLEIKKCQTLSIENIKCDNYDGKCVCVWDEVKKNNIPYWKLTSSSCDCKCRVEICNCICDITK